MLNLDYYDIFRLPVQHVLINQVFIYKIKVNDSFRGDGRFLLHVTK